LAARGTPICSSHLLHAHQKIPGEHLAQDCLFSHFGKAGIRAVSLKMAEQSSYYTPYPVLVHPYPGPTPGSRAYERLPPLDSSAARAQPKNALIFIGGITDGPHGAPFLGPLVAGLQKEGSWSLFEPRIASAFSGWGFGSLADDVRDLAALVAYLRKIRKEKIVLMGHSTGSNVSLPPFPSF
jgi:hypothetical protein